MSKRRVYLIPVRSKVHGLILRIKPNLACYRWLEKSERLKEQEVCMPKGYVGDWPAP